MSYEKRICCFIDILGFRHHITETVANSGEDNNKKIESIKHILELAKKMTDDGGFSKSKIVTYFSDSIVISYDFKEPSQLYHTLIDLLYLSFELANQGYLVRGGVTIGKLIHTPEYIFGPAMVKAYDLESKNALYPRIIVEREVVDIATNYRTDNHSLEDERKYIYDILSEDDDGYLYVDYITNASSEFNDMEYDLYDYILRLKSFLDNFENQKEDVKIRLKWLKNKINQHIILIHKNIESAKIDVELRDYFRTLELIK